MVHVTGFCKKIEFQETDYLILPLTSEGDPVGDIPLLGLQAVCWNYICRCARITAIKSPLDVLHQA